MFVTILFTYCLTHAAECHQVRLPAPIEEAARAQLPLSCARLAQQVAATYLRETLGLADGSYTVVWVTCDLGSADRRPA